MNDLVFVMYNSKMKERQTKKTQTTQMRLIDVSSDDEWITEEDNSDLPENREWPNVLNINARREAYNINENCKFVLIYNFMTSL